MEGGVHGRGACMQERQPLKQSVRILLECTVVFQDFTFLICLLNVFSSRATFNDQRTKSPSSGRICFGVSHHVLMYMESRL